MEQEELGLESQPAVGSRMWDPRKKTQLVSCYWSQPRSLVGYNAKSSFLLFACEQGTGDRDLGTQATPMLDDKGHRCNAKYHSCD